MHGLHLITELHGCGCAAALLCDAGALRELCQHEIRAAGLTIVGELFHAFAPARAGEPAGVTGVVLLAESHLALHTWPELGVVTLDIYVCNRRHDAGPAARQVLAALQRAFDPARSDSRELTRSAVQSCA
ncbi:MAG: adenosylmethionine decarboxylase [Leptothrix sp. (in: b-proteobacteria)]